MVKLRGDQNLGPESPLRSRKEQERRKRKRCQERGGTMKSRGVRVVERKEVGGDDSIEYFFPTKV